MKPTTRAFTLIELLFVLAILLVLAAVLFPVFQSVKESARRTKCLSNFHQVHLSSGLYVGDYDDRVMPINQQPGVIGNSSNDRTWVQLTLPYLRSFYVFQCPSDTGRREKIEATFDGDEIPGDTFSQYYKASLRVNLGYNYMYLAPVIKSGKGWESNPRDLSSVTDTSKTLMFVDSVWDRTKDGVPTGGGNWLVIPPCRYILEGSQRRDSFLPAGDGNHSDVFTPQMQFGWDSQNQNSANRYGGAWPWHQGRINVIRVDGNAKSLSPADLADGCDLQSRWKGLILDRGRYNWNTD